MKKKRKKPEEIELSPAQKDEIREKVMAFISAGNPRGFLMKLGIIDLKGEIDFKKASAVLQTVEDNREEIEETLKEGGYRIDEREADPMATEGIIGFQGF